jgi:glycosyltransferase involved in cell wall biosynthesis
MTRKTTLKIGALIPYPLNVAPGQRYRIEQWAEYLEEQGIEVEMLPFADEALMRSLHQPGAYWAKASGLTKCFARRVRLLFSLRKYDALYLFRAISIVGPAWLEQVLPWLGRPVIFDFDDAIYHLHTTTANRAFGWLKFPGKTASLCRLSSHVIVGNGYLADYARQHNAAVTVIPSSVDTDAYSAQKKESKKESNDKLIVGWTGSSTSQTYLESFAPLLKELSQRCGVEFHVISDRKPVMPGVPVVWHRWSPATEISDLARFDIGIMPMPDDQWSRGKCAMKALLYMAMGIPTVCAAVGMNVEVIQHGENGLLARTDEEWLAALQSLIDDAALRQRLGAAGRKTIEEHYSMRHCAEHFAQVIRETLVRQNETKEVKRWLLQKFRNSAQ